MSYVKFWAHAVWGTKYHLPVLSDDFRPKVFQHIAENAQKKKIYIDTINGFVDHVHCLISMEPRQNIADIIQLLKGESSYWAGNTQDINWKGWADDYCAISVSPSNVNRARAYIRNQEKHHRKITFQQEWDRFVTESGFVVAFDDSVHVPSIPPMNRGVSVHCAGSAEDRTGLSPSCKDRSQSKHHILTPRFSGGMETDKETDNTNLIR